MKSSASRVEARLGAKPPSSPTVGVVACALQRVLQRVEHFGAHAHRLGEARRADRHDHEFLEVDRIVGMHAAIDDVHHRHGQQRRLRPADIAIERHALRGGLGLGRGHRHAEDGVGAEPLLVLACRRDRAGAGRGRAGRRRRSRPARWRISPLTASTAFLHALAAVARCRRRAARCASCAPVEAPEGTAARP